MARIKMEEIVDHLSTEVRKALSATINNTMQNAEIDDRKLYREFKRAIGRKCSTWERVPDNYVDKDL